MTFSVIVSPQAKKELAALHEEDHIRCIADLGLLAMNPYPGYGGDKEKLKGYRNRTGYTSGDPIRQFMKSIKK